MTPPRGKQRSIHMDDETFDILERLAGEYKANNSTIVRMALIQFDKGGTTQRVSSGVPAAEIGASQQLPREPEQPANPKHIALPDPKVSSFSVSGGKVRGKVPRNDREDDGLDV